MIQALLLGQPAIRAEGSGVRLGNTKAYALLAYMILQGRDSYSVEDLTDLLWPLSPADRARHALSQTVYQIKRRVGVELIARIGDRLSLRRELVDSDVACFQSYMARGCWLEAFSLYRGDFLEGLRIDADYRFQHWRDASAAALQAHFERCVRALIDTANTAEPSSVEQWTRIALAFRANDIDVVALHYRAIAEQGRTIEAETGLADQIRALRQDLSSSQINALSDLADRLAQQRQLRSLGPTYRSLPFIGRAEELSRLRGRWLAGAAGELGVLCILGEPGVGKTRLAEQVGRFAAIRGGTVVSTCGSPATQRIPYSAVVEIATQLMKGIDKTTASEYGALRAIIEGHLEAVGAPALQERLVYTELLRLARTVASRNPLLLMVDDLQWIDETSVDIFRYLAFGLKGVASLLMMSCRPEAEPTCSLFEEVAVTELHHLMPLSEDDAASLISAVCGAAYVSPSESTTRTLVARAGGNPFFLVALAELTEARKDDRHDAASKGLPQSIFALLASRMRALEPTALEVLRCLAVLRDTANVETLASMIGASSLAVARGLEALVRMRLAAVSGGYAHIAHDLVAEVTYEATPQATRETLHGRAAVVLQPRGAGIVALHAFRANMRQRAFEAALQAAVESRQLRASKEAGYYILLALDAAPSEADYDRAAAEYVHHLCELDRPLMSLDYVPAARRHSLRTNDLAGQIRCAGVEIDSAIGRANILLVDAYEDLYNLIARALTLPDHNLASYLMWIVGRAGELGGDMRAVERWLATAATIAPHASPEWQVPLLGRSAVFSVYVGDDCKAEAIVKDMADRAQEDARLKATALAYTGVVLMLLGRLDEAQQCFHTGIEMTADPVMVGAQYKCAVNLGVLEIDIGQYEAARLHFDVRTNVSVAPSLVVQANLTILALESGDDDAAYTAACALENAPSAPEVLVVKSTIHAVKGLLALKRSDLDEAEKAASALRHLIAARNYVSDDSYARIVVARVSGRHDAGAALEVLDAPTATRRAAVPQLRIDLERAYHLRRIDRPAGDAALHEVKARAEKMGALPIAKRAQVVLDGGELP